VNNSYSRDQGRAKIYKRNEQGLFDLKVNLGIIESNIELTEKNQQELISGDFTYTEKSNRFFHPLQHIPSKIRAGLFAEYGYSYNFDIKCAAPTLICQYARKLGMIEPTPAIDAYLLDRSSIRQNIAQDVGITPEDVKFLINAVLQGARISHYTESSIFNKLGCNHNIISQLQSNSYICLFQEEVKTCWSYIKADITPEYITDIRGRVRTKPLYARDKARIYRELEQQVMGEISSYLKKRKIVMFKEHDGWRTRQMIDVRELASHVRINAGYLIDIDWEVQL
jgi:hypothetical protein